jgi:exonuclease SbcD
MHAFDGNHDFNGKPGKRDATAPLVEALSDEPWFRWHARRFLVDEFAPGVRALFIPHGAKPRAEVMPPDEKTNLVFCHTTIQGAVSGAEETLLADKVRDLGEVTGRVDAYLSGHIHKAQEFEYRGSLVVYAGSPERIDFGERDESKSFALIDLSKVQVERHRSYRRVRLNTRPFVQIDAVVDETWNAAARSWPDVRGAVVKAVVHVQERDLARFVASDVRALLLAAGADYVSGFTMDIERERKVRDALMTERLTPADALKRYVDKNVPQKTAEEKVIAARIVERGIAVLAEASHV